MTEGMDFALKILATFFASGLVFIWMDRTHQARQKRAEEKFQMALKAIELRNKRVKDESEEKT